MVRCLPRSFMPASCLHACDSCVAQGSQLLVHAALWDLETKATKPPSDPAGDVIAGIEQTLVDPSRSFTILLASPYIYQHGQPKRQSTLEPGTVMEYLGYKIVYCYGVAANSAHLTDGSVEVDTLWPPHSTSKYISELTPAATAVVWHKGNFYLVDPAILTKPEEQVHSKNIDGYKESGMHLLLLCPSSLRRQWLYMSTM